MTKARDNATQGGLVLINKTTFTGASTLNINNCFSSTYSNYRILLEFTDGAGGTGNSINWQSRNNGTNDTSGPYSWAGAIMVSTTLSTAANSSATSGFLGWTPISTGWGQTSLDIYQPFLAEYTTILAHNAGVTSGSDAWANVQTMRRVALSHDGISFTFNNGNNTGTIYIYGYKV